MYCCCLALKIIKIKLSSKKQKEKTKKILDVLYNKRQLIYDIAEMINGGNFRDEMFFGKPVIWWINIKSHYWLTSLVETRIKTQDNNISSIIGLFLHGIRLR